MFQITPQVEPVDTDDSGDDTPETLEASRKFIVTKVNREEITSVDVEIATEVPFTITVNNVDIATLMCTPTNPEQLAYGFLYTSGFVKKIDDIRSYYCDETRWRCEITTSKKIDIELLNKRVYTSGCGKGVMYSSVIELSSRKPLQNDFSVEKTYIVECMKWLQHCSLLYKKTGAVHTAALAVKKKLPSLSIDDVGRHNAVDKIIGQALVNKMDFSEAMLLCTGRISSDILHKAKRCGVPILLSRGAPTHNTILLAREMGLTVVGFARGGSFTIYSHENRIILT